MKYLTSVLLQGLLLIAAPLAPVSALAELPFEPVKRAFDLEPTALVETNKGSFEIAFFREAAPVTVQNFIHLVRTGFYDGTGFSQMEAGFALQGGAPRGKPDVGYTIPPEFSALEHLRGTVSMARWKTEKNPDRRSHGNQFFICLTKASHLDGLYNTFATVIRGMDVVERLEKGDVINRIRLPKDWSHS